MRNLIDNRDRDLFIRWELEQAGITIFERKRVQSKTGVPSKLEGRLCGWKFVRAWVYWVAEGPELPLSYASPLHNMAGKVVRAWGYTGEVPPEELQIGQYQGIPKYYIDTQEGLNLFAAVLRQWESNEAGGQQ